MCNLSPSESLSSASLRVQGRNSNCDKGTEAQLEYSNRKKKISLTNVGTTYADTKAQQQFNKQM